MVVEATYLTEFLAVRMNKKSIRAGKTHPGCPLLNDVEKSHIAVAAKSRKSHSPGERKLLRKLILRFVRLWLGEVKGINRLFLWHAARSAYFSHRLGRLRLAAH